MSVTQQQFRCAIYARVSTREQTEKNQLRELTAYARRRRFRVAHELVDKESGAKEDRKNVLRLMDLARKRQVDVPPARQATDKHRGKRRQAGFSPARRPI